MSLPLIAAIALGSVAVWSDLRTRMIPVWIPLALLLAGLALHTGATGWTGAGESLGGAACGFFVFFVFYWLGGMGGGDLKLMAGYGALLGMPGVWHAAILAAIIGSVLAFGVLVFSRVRQWRDGRKEAVRTIPYAPAIVAGSWLVVWAGSAG